MDDDAIRALLTRLARPDPSGGDVIERAAILAAGSDFTAVMRWVIAHGGKAETVAAAAPSGGLHGARVTEGGGEESTTPLRFVLPPGTLARQAEQAR
jgi:hypothetical protein